MSGLNVPENTAILHLKLTHTDGMVIAVLHTASQKPEEGMELARLRSDMYGVSEKIKSMFEDLLVEAVKEVTEKMMGVPLLGVTKMYKHDLN